MRLKDICESGLSRTHSGMTQHDCAIITAHRQNPCDLTACAADVTAVEKLKQRNIDTIMHNKSGEIAINDRYEFIKNYGGLYSEINKVNNRDLKAVLRQHGCGVTEVDGSFTENFGTSKAVDVREDSMFVVNLKDDPDFKNLIIQLGKEYCQDSVLLIDKGTDKAYLYGTNKSGEFPKLDQEMYVGSWLGGHGGQFHTRVDGRPFVFREENLSRNAAWCVSLIIDYRKKNNLAY